MLFYPWREEGENLKKDCETFEQMYQTVHRTVDSKAKQYEKNVEELERAIEQAEGDNNQYDELAPGTQQVECEDIEEGTTDAEQYIYSFVFTQVITC
jgi:septation ring formation regulator EzrA